MKPLLIGLTGPMGCGKTTVATHLIREHGFTEYSFASPLKDMLCAMLGITEIRLEELKRSELPILPERNGEPFPSMRRALQTIGTEWGRQQIHSELWLALAEQRIAAMSNWLSMDRIVISDVRFENEADFIRQKGGIVIHIQPENRTHHTHASESGVRIEASDYVLANKGTLHELYTTTDTAIWHISGLRVEEVPAKVPHEWDEECVCKKCGLDGAEASFYSQRGYEHEYPTKDNCPGKRA